MTSKKAAQSRHVGPASTRKSVQKVFKTDGTAEVGLGIDQSNTQGIEVRWPNGAVWRRCAAEQVVARLSPQFAEIATETRELYRILMLTRTTCVIENLRQKLDGT
jgi:hypothetical protein